MGLEAGKERRLDSNLLDKHRLKKEKYGCKPRELYSLLITSFTSLIHTLNVDLSVAQHTSLLLVSVMVLLLCRSHG
jgi:hypothetical protein